jgi:prepilin-type N-terminal cleavage/methylation domain-containing protein
MAEYRWRPSLVALTSRYRYAVIMVPAAAFSLIELLVVVVIIAVLAALLIPGIAIVREKARLADTRLFVQQVQAAAELYRGEDPQRRYPPVRADRTLRWDRVGGGTADMLEVRGLAVSARNTATIDGGAAVLADAWGQALCYHLDNHTSGDGIAVMPDDAAGERVRVPEDVTDWNPPRGSPARQAVPFAYLWSWGRPQPGHDLRANARSWVYARQESPAP